MDERMLRYFSTYLMNIFSILFITITVSLIKTKSWVKYLEQS